MSPMPKWPPSLQRSLKLPFEEKVQDLTQSPWGLGLIGTPLALIMVGLTWAHRQGLCSVQRALPLLVIVAVLTAFAVAFWLHWTPKARYSPTFYNLLDRAERGDSEAQFRLGLIYRDGREGFPRDPAGARHWLDRAAAQRHPGALQVQAEGYAPASAPPPIPVAPGEQEGPESSVLTLWRRSLPFVILVSLLGTLLFLLGTALALFLFAWTATALGAMVFLAWLLVLALIASVLLWAVRSRGMKYRPSIRTLFKEAQAGRTEAQRRLAQAYQNGAPGLHRDGSQAAWWMGRAASQGDAEAAYLMARWADQGLGQPRNRTAAQAWLELAVAAGHGPAQVLARRWNQGGDA
ncbi:MAG: hypothetical protein H6Q00_2288 [Holophagaceae bacterium]|nr:hypothetical protein [Holophagaceae bacterium]